MNAKWYVSTLFLIIVFLGLSKEQKNTSNQQITLQFVDMEVASDHTQKEVLDLIQQKLMHLGITGVEIIENDEKQVSLRYYSSVNAATVAQFLSEEEGLKVSNEGRFPSDHPEEKDTQHCHVVVSELKLPSDHTFGLNGSLVNTNHAESKTVHQPLPSYFVVPLQVEKVSGLELPQQITGTIFIVSDQISSQIPEVRAGPLAS